MNEYSKLLTENISNLCKISTLSIMHSSNTEAKTIAQDLKLDKWIEQ